MQAKHGGPGSVADFLYFQWFLLHSRQFYNTPVLAQVLISGYKNTEGCDQEVAGIPQPLCWNGNSEPDLIRVPKSWRKKNV
jgi:hypothetical protein